MIPSIIKQFVQWTLAVPLALLLMILLEDVAPNGQWASVLVPVMAVAVLISRCVVNWVWASEQPKPSS
ncbi:hypothetical protein [Lysobacter terrae]